MVAPITPQRNSRKHDENVVKQEAKTAKNIPDRIMVHYQLSGFSKSIDTLFRFLETNQLPLNVKKSGKSKSPKRK